MSGVFSKEMMHKNQKGFRFVVPAGRTKLWKKETQ